MAATFKVATLIVKTLVKPIANQLKKNAANEGWFREACGQVGQAHNLIMTHIQLRSMGHKVKKVKPLPTDEAVKSGADLFAEGMVLGTGLLAIGAEVFRKQRSDRAAALRVQLEEIEEKKRKELRLIEKERQLRELLHGLEARIIEMENSKIQQLHEKLLHEQIKHISVTDNLLKRLRFLEDQLHITNQFPLLVKDVKSLDILRQRTNDLYKNTSGSANKEDFSPSVITVNTEDLPHSEDILRQQSLSQYKALNGTDHGNDIGAITARALPPKDAILVEQNAGGTTATILTSQNPLIRHDVHEHDDSGNCQLDATNIIDSIIDVNLPREVLIPEPQFHHHVIPVAVPPQQPSQVLDQVPSQTAPQVVQEPNVNSISSTTHTASLPVPDHDVAPTSPAPVMVVPSTLQPIVAAHQNVAQYDGHQIFVKGLPMDPLEAIEPLLDIIPHPDDSSDD